MPIWYFITWGFKNNFNVAIRTNILEKSTLRGLSTSSYVGNGQVSGVVVKKSNIFFLRPFESSFPNFHGNPLRIDRVTESHISCCEMQIFEANFDPEQLTVNLLTVQYSSINLRYVFPSMGIREIRE